MWIDQAMLAVSNVSSQGCTFSQSTQSFDVCGAKFTTLVTKLSSLIALVYRRRQLSHARGYMYVVSSRWHVAALRIATDVRLTWCHAPSILWLLLTLSILWRSAHAILRLIAMLWLLLTLAVHRVCVGGVAGASLPNDITNSSENKQSDCGADTSDDGDAVVGVVISGCFALSAWMTHMMCSTWTLFRIALRMWMP